jgi:hypothetical protein
MTMADLPRVDEHIRRHLTKELAPRRIRKLRGIAKLAKLTHHGVLSNKRRVQTADHLEQKLISIAPEVGLGTRFISESPGLASVQENNPSQARLPLQVGEPVWDWFRAIWAKVNDDKFIYHH